eukprot:4695328-Pleurochrysis_carterae.AAC.4
MPLVGGAELNGAASGDSTNSWFDCSSRSVPIASRRRCVGRLADCAAESTQYYSRRMDTQMLRRSCLFQRGVYARQRGTTQRVHRFVYSQIMCDVPVKGESTVHAQRSAESQPAIARDAGRAVLKYSESVPLPARAVSCNHAASEASIIPLSNNLCLQ